MEQQKPGGLKISLDLVLDTKEATALFYGRQKTQDHQTIIGLDVFAQRVHYINNAARNDDPYADYFLLKVERALELADDKLTDYQQELNAKLSDESLLQINTGKSSKPIVLTTDFSNPYANIGAQLLKKADKVFLTIHVLAHLGIFDREEKNKLVEEVKRLMRRTFLSQSGYKFFQINRKDVELMTARGHEAYVAMRFKAPLSKDIIDKRHRAAHAPNIVPRASDLFKKQPSTYQKTTVGQVAQNSSENINKPTHNDNKEAVRE